MKKVQIIFIIIILAITSAAVAQEKILHKKVDAYDRSISITIDGKEQTLTTKPLIIDGKVMLAARDVAKLLDKPVVWSNKYNLLNFSYSSKVLDFPTDTIIKEVKRPTAAAPNFRYIQKMQVLRNVGPFYQLATRKIAIAGKQFKNGVVVDLDPTNLAQKTIIKSPIPGEILPPKILAEVKLFLNGNYSGLDGYVGTEDATMNAKAGFYIRVFADGLLRYESPLIEPGEVALFLAKDMLGDLGDVKILKIQIEQQDVTVSPGDSAKTRVALADFKFYRKY